MSGIVGSSHNIRGSGVVAKLGTDGQVFTSAGAGVSQGFEDASGGGLTLTSEQATTSGSAVTFGSIPTGTKQITLMIDSVSTDSSGYIGVQIGDSGGLETSGYISAMGGHLNNDALAGEITGYFHGVQTLVAANTYFGHMIMNLQDATNNVWAFQGQFGDGVHGAKLHDSGTGRKALSGELTQVALISGDTLDAGAVSISYM